MKWFKHMADSIDNPTIQKLLDNYGSKGYFLYFGTIEILAKEDALTEPVSLDVRFLSKKLRTRVELLLNFYSTIPELLVTSYDQKLKEVKLFCPKMQQIKDNYRKDLQDNTKPLARDYKALYKEVEVEKEKEKDTTSGVDFESILKKWNSLPLPKGKVIKLSDSRKDKYKKRLTEGFDLDKIITKISNSTFLQGQNKNNWVVSFDWLIENDKNFLKVMEGNYDNKGDIVETVVETKDYDITDFDDKALTIQGEKFEQKEYNTQKEKWARRQYLKKIGANK